MYSLFFRTRKNNSKEGNQLVFEYSVSTGVNRDEAAVDVVGLEMGMVLSAVTFWTMIREEI